MPDTQQSLSRITVESSDEFIRFGIPIKYHWQRIVSMSFALVVCLFVVYSFIPKPFNLNFVTSLSCSSIMIFWTTLGIALLLWDIIRGSIGIYETIEVNSRSIMVSLPLLGLRHRVYDVDRIENLRVDIPNHWQNPFTSGTITIFERLDGSICFDYGSKVCRFGHMLNKDEALSIISSIQQRFTNFP